MIPLKKDWLRELHLAFVGKMMAGLSHEFKNHLAIIKELNGLLGDLLALDKPGQSGSPERYKKIISEINERITQAAEMCNVLSGFAHRMDQPFSSFRADDVLQEKVYLLSRFARQKQVNLASAFAENLPAVFNNPSLLQFAVFCIIWPALESLQPGGRISIKCGPKCQSVEIVIAFEGIMERPEGDTPWEDMLPEVLQILGAGLSRRIDQDGNKEAVVTISSIENPARDDL